MVSKSISSVLLVDDDPNVHGLFELVMQHHQIQLNVVNDAESALDYLATNQPKIVVMDIFLPGMDGYQALKKLRSLDDNLKHTVVATSAYYTSDSLQTITSSGFDGFIAKPINPTQIVPYLESIIE